MSTSAFLRSLRGSSLGSHAAYFGSRPGRRHGQKILKRKWDGAGLRATSTSTPLGPSSSLPLSWSDVSSPLFVGSQSSAFSTFRRPAFRSCTEDQKQPEPIAIPFPEPSIWSAYPALDALWQAMKPNIPKGFENFFPKNGAPGKEQSDASADSSKKDEGSTDIGTSTPFKSKSDNGQRKQNKKGSGVPPPGQDEWENIPALLSLLAALILGRRLLDSNADDDHSRNGKEITFVEFRNQLLNAGQVEKVVVVNNKLARVILHPGARGLSPNGTSSVSIPADWDNNEHEGSDATVMEFDSAPSADATPAGSKAADQSPSSSGTPLYHFYIGSVESFEDKLTKAQHNVQPRDWVPVQYVNETNLIVEGIKLLPTLVTLALFMQLTRSLSGAAGAGGPGGPGGLFQVGKSKAKKINPEEVTVSFKDVAGCQQAKQEIMEFVDFLQDSSRFSKLGAKIPKGALLCGPPGTGKTLLAKAVAGEAGVPFFSISGSDFIEMFVGVGPSRVRDLFKEARANSPCIVFIDEIDAVGRQRGRGGFSGGNDERENTLNQLLVEMDGFTPTTGVVVLAGTNRVDILDQALTRPGRFDRQITVDKPDLQGRKEIFHVHLKGIKLEGDVEEYAGRLAGLTPGFAGADIANICNEAAIVAARRKGESVTVDDFEKATDRIIGGLESTKLMSEQEKSIVAHHEAGHAVAGWFLEHADPLLKVTIIPRTSGALGFAQYLPKEVNLRTQEQIMDIVCMALAGRAAEQVFFDRVTTGASDDLRRVTQIVYSTIQTYGMNSRVGQLAYSQEQGTPGDKPYSDATAEAMDDEARAIVDAAYQRTLDLIRERKDEVEKIAQLLMEKETITHDDVVDLIGERPFTGDKQYQEFVSRRHGTFGDDKKINEKVEPPEEHQDGGLEPGLLSRGSPIL